MYQNFWDPHTSADSTIEGFSLTVKDHIYFTILGVNWFSKKLELQWTPRVIELIKYFAMSENPLC